MITRDEECRVNLTIRRGLILIPTPIAKIQRIIGLGDVELDIDVIGDLLSVTQRGRLAEDI